MPGRQWHRRHGYPSSSWSGGRWDARSRRALSRPRQSCCSERGVGSQQLRVHTVQLAPETPKRWLPSLPTERRGAPSGPADGLVVRLAVLAHGHDDARALLLSRLDRVHVEVGAAIRARGDGASPSAPGANLTEVRNIRSAPELDRGQHCGQLRSVIQRRASWPRCSNYRGLRKNGDCRLGKWVLVGRLWVPRPGEVAPFRLAAHSSSLRGEPASAVCHRLARPVEFYSGKSRN